MGDNLNLSNLGEQIRSSVTEALNTGDFSALNSLVSETVTCALQEAGEQAAREKERQKEKLQRQYQEWQDSQEEQKRREKEQRENMQREQELRWQEMQQRHREQQQRHQERKEQSLQEAQAKQAARTPNQVLADMRRLVKIRRVGSVSGVFCTLFGALGLGGAVFGAVSGFFAWVFGGKEPGRMVLSLALAAVAAFLLNNGTKLRARLNRADRYLQLCGYKMYAMVEELAKQTGKSVRYVRRDLRRMLKKGFFPEGHLDDKESCFMLNDTVYGQYMQTADAYRQAEETAKALEEAAKAPKSLAEQVAEEQRAREAELNAMVAEGMEYIRKLRDLNDNIPGEPISGQLFQLEGLLKEIFDRVREHPEQMHRMHKLMDYYLPTTLKLVEAYEEFGRVSARVRIFCPPRLR